VTPFKFRRDLLGLKTRLPRLSCGIITSSYVLPLWYNTRVWLTDRHTMTVNTSLKLRSHQTESHQISKDVQKWLPTTLQKSKLRFSNRFGNANVTDEDRRQIAGESRQKFARFNCVNSEITGRKFTKFGHYVAWLLPLNVFKADLRSANPLSNAEATSKGRSTLRLWTSPKFNWLP